MSPPAAECGFGVQIQICETRKVLDARARYEISRTVFLVAESNWQFDIGHKSNWRAATCETHNWSKVQQTRELIARLNNPQSGLRAPAPQCWEERLIRADLSFSPDFMRTDCLCIEARRRPITMHTRRSCNIQSGVTFRDHLYQARERCCNLLIGTSDQNICQSVGCSPRVHPLIFIRCVWAAHYGRINHTAAHALPRVIRHNEMRLSQWASARGAHCQRQKSWRQVHKCTKQRDAERHFCFAIQTTQVQFFLCLMGCNRIEKNNNQLYTISMALLSF